MFLLLRFNLYVSTSKCSIFHYFASFVSLLYLPYIFSSVIYCPLIFIIPLHRFYSCCILPNANLCQYAYSTASSISLDMICTARDYLVSIIQPTMFKRMYSTQPAKLSSLPASIIEKLTCATRTTIYYSKVAGEIGRYVWKNEAMSPPSIGEFQQAFSGAFKSAQGIRSSFKSDAGTFGGAQSLELVQSVNSIGFFKVAAVVLQLAGIFTLGEMIGRRHVYGFKKYEH